MKIIEDFKKKSKESLDYTKLTRMVLQEIRAVCGKDINGGIFIPYDSFSEWVCQQAINKDLISTDSQTVRLMDQLSGVAEFFSGYPGDVFCYTNMDKLEEVYGSYLPFFTEGYNFTIYAAQHKTEPLAVCVLMTEKPLTDNQNQNIGRLMDIFANQLGKSVEIHNRLKDCIHNYFNPWDEIWLEVDEDEDEEDLY